VNVDIANEIQADIQVSKLHTPPESAAFSDAFFEVAQRLQTALNPPAGAELGAAAQQEEEQQDGQRDAQQEEQEPTGLAALCVLGSVRALGSSDRGRLRTRDDRRGHGSCLG
jgi:hypothetical protein